MIQYYINKAIDTEINNWAIALILNRAGIKAKKINQINDTIHLYYGNDPNEINLLANSLIIKNKKTTANDIIALNDETNLTALNFDLVQATIILLTDSIHNNLGPENFDIHQRLKGTCSFQYKLGLIKTPIINTYTELIKRTIAQKFNCTPIPYYPKNYKSVIILSHDVDEPLRYAILNKQKDKLHHLSFRNKITHQWHFLRKRIRKALFNGGDSFWNIEKIIKKESSLGFTSTFFFTAKSKFNKGSSFRFDNSYDVSWSPIENAFKLLNENGFEISLHSSYNSTINPIFFNEEKERLEKFSKKEIIGNRHHFWHLGKNPEKTLLNHQKANLKYDSSIAFNDIAGYRRNAAFAFYPFHLKENKKICTLQIPNLMMDTNIVKPDNIQASLKEAVTYIEELRNNHGVAAINWHSRMAYPNDKKLAIYGEVYIELLDYLAQQEDIWVTNFENYYNWHKKREKRIKENK